MKLTNTQKNSTKRGMTLLELTVVILVLLSLISILFVGARAWMKGSDRASSIMVIRNSQQGARAASSLVGVEGNTDGTTWTAMPTGAPALTTSVFMTDGSGYVTTDTTDGNPPNHPATGVAFAFEDAAGATVPPLGALYIASDDDEYNPLDSDIAGW